MIRISQHQIWGFHFIGVRDIQLATLLKSDHFRRCSSRIQIFLYFEISCGLIRAPPSMYFDNLQTFLKSTFTNHWIERHSRETTKNVLVNIAICGYNFFKKQIDIRYLLQNMALNFVSRKQ